MRARGGANEARSALRTREFPFRSTFTGLMRDTAYALARRGVAYSVARAARFLPRRREPRQQRRFHTTRA